MADTKKTEQSFFDWVWPGDAPVARLWLMAFLVLLAFLGLLFLVFRPAGQLSIDGGRDQIAAGLPYFDGGIPKDQIAAGYPFEDDPELFSVGPARSQGSVEDGGDADDGTVEGDGTDQDDFGDEPADGSDISDEPTQAEEVVEAGDEAAQDVAVVAAIQTGTWDLTIREWGAAVCGYPVDPYTYAATLTISATEPTDEATSDRSDGDSEDPHEIRLELPFQIFIGSGMSLPFSLTASGDGWTEVRTVEELDVERGVLTGTSVYETDDCLAERFLEAVNF